MVARAVYRQLAYLMLDETTSALDAGNERQIIEQLRAFCAVRTTLMVTRNVRLITRIFNEFRDLC